MNKVKKIGLFFIFLGFLSGIDSFAQPNQRGHRGMKPDGMLRGEVTDVRTDEIVVNISSGGVQNIKRTSELKVSKERRRTLQDIAIGQNIMVMGQQEVGQRYRAFIIRILSEETPAAGPPGMKGTRGPIQGKVTGITPLRVNTYKGNIEVDLSEVKNIFEETPAKADELKAGDNVILIGPQGRIMKIIIVDQPFPEQKKYREGGSVRNEKESERALPMPPIPKISLFKKESMDEKKDSPFGFKDPNMLRVDLFSWYGEFAEVMNDLGAYWMEPSAIWAFHWNLLQQKNHDGTYTSFDWERFDRLVRYAQAFNIHISAKIHASPPQEADFSKHEKVFPALPRDMEAYRNFVRAVVERYDGDGKDDMPGLLYHIKHWKIEDEVMSPRYFRGSGADYAKIVDAAYNAIKAADKTATVILSMLYGYIGIDGSKTFMEDFFAEFSRLSKKRKWDIMDQHWMVTDKKISPEKQYREIKRYINDVADTSKRYGFETAPFWAMEVAGIPSPEKAHAMDMFKRHIYALSVGVKKVFWSGLAQRPPHAGHTGMKEPDLLEKVTFIDAQGNRKLAYYTYKKLVEVFDGVDLDRIQTIKEGPDVYVFKFIKNGKPIWCVWNEFHRPVKEKIKIMPGVKNVRVIDALPLASTGRKVVDYAGAFRSSVTSVSNGTIELEIGDVPLIITVD